MVLFIRRSHVDDRFIVRDILLKRRDATGERITWQIESERKGIFTLNEEDLYSYKKDFVSACHKDAPFGSRNSSSVDVNNPALSIMGTVRGYFHGKRKPPVASTLELTPTTVSHRRFLDNIPLAINHELIYGLIHPDRGRLQDALYERLGLDGVGAEAQCEKLLQEPPNVQETREHLEGRYGRLSEAAAALENAIY